MHGRIRERRSYSPLGIAVAVGAVGLGMASVAGARRAHTGAGSLRPSSAAAESCHRACSALGHGPAFASPRAAARSLGLPESGPGSLVHRADGRLLVEIRTADPSPSGVADLRAAGAQIVNVSPAYSTVTASVGAERARPRSRPTPTSRTSTRCWRRSRPGPAKRARGRVRPAREHLPPHDLRRRHAHERRGGARPERGRRRGPDDRCALRLLQHRRDRAHPRRGRHRVRGPARPGQPVRVHDTGQGAGRLHRRPAARRGPGDDRARARPRARQRNFAFADGRERPARLRQPGHPAPHDESRVDHRRRRAVPRRAVLPGRARRPGGERRERGRCPVLLGRRQRERRRRRQQRVVVRDARRIRSTTCPAVGDRLRPERTPAATTSIRTAAPTTATTSPWRPAAGSASTCSGRSRGAA